MSTTAFFWYFAGALMALVALILSWPLLRRHSVAAGTSNRTINTSIYREKLAELVSERDKGVLSEAAYHEAHIELERRLIEDTRNDQKDATTTQSATGQRSIRTVITLLVLIPLAAIPLYLTLGKPAALDPAAAQPIAANDANSQMAHLNQMVAKLTEKLDKDPNNPKDWVMLGRVYRALGRYDKAEQAYLRAGPVANADSALILERVEMVLDKTGGHIEGEALKLLNGVIKREPGNGRARFFAGYGAFSRADYKAAIAYWEPLLKQVQAGSQDAQNLERGIAEARARLGVNAPTMSMTDATVASPSVATTNNAAFIRGKVSLSPTLKAKASPSDTVFIFARALQGPPMPLAAIRITVADLPMEFTLDDSLSMSPQAKLSLFKNVRIEARVAKSGDVAAKSGDLVGIFDSVKVGTTGLALTIDHVLP